MTEHEHLERGLRRGDRVEVEITDVTERGLGRAEKTVLVGPQREQKTYEIFVRKAIPGDQVLVELEQTRRKRCTGRWVEMLKPSPIRITPRCEHFGRREDPGKGCGGCTFQSLSYRHQLSIKERMIKDHFKAHGVDPGLVLPVLGMDDPWYYRNKMEFSFGDDATRTFSLGLHPTGYRHDVLNLSSCHLMSPFVSDFVPALRKWAAEEAGAERVTEAERMAYQPYHGGRDEGFLRSLILREGKRTGERLLVLLTAGLPLSEGPGREVADAFADAAERIAATLGGAFTSIYWTRMDARKGQSTTWEDELLRGQPVLTEELHLPGERALRFEIHPRAFFQPNTLGAERLYAEVLKKTGLLEDHQVRNALDLYCGTGTIGLCLAPFVERVVGIELQRDAVENARKNARFNGIHNVEFFAGDVGAVLKSPELDLPIDAMDLIVVDPPRSGLFDQAVEQILELNAPRLVYVSCNPKTLAKNAAELIAGGYTLEVVQPVDLFPHTFHVEHVALFSRP